jgi:hypothetical protein
MELAGEAAEAVVGFACFGFPPCPHFRDIVFMAENRSCHRQLQNIQNIPSRRGRVRMWVGTVPNFPILKIGIAFIVQEAA